MCTKFFEASLAVRYCEKNKDGDYVGGPMYYIKNGIQKKKCRDAPPGASGKGLLGHNVAGKGSRDDTPNGRTQFAPTAHGLPFCP